MRLGKEDRHREFLPYGAWRCADGSEVLYNRRCHPIWQREAGQPATKADPTWLVPWVEAANVYDDLSLPWKSDASEERCLLVLGKFLIGDSVTNLLIEPWSAR
jgi:hypothetical protein